MSKRNINLLKQKMPRQELNMYRISTYYAQRRQQSFFHCPQESYFVWRFYIDGVKLQIASTFILAFRRWFLGSAKVLQ